MAEAMSTGSAPSAAGADTGSGSSSAPSESRSTNYAGTNAPTQTSGTKESQGGQNSPATPKNVHPTPTSNPDIFEVTVNGKKVKMTRQEALDRASMSYRANEKFEEASALKKQHEKFQEAAKKNVLEALMDPALGLTKDQIREQFENWYAKEYIEPETLSPEQRQLQQAQREAKEYKEKWEKQENEKKQAEFNTLTQRERENYQKQIVDALEASNLPKKNPEIIKKIAFYMQQNNKNGWDAPMDMIIRQVQEERQTMFKSELEDMSIDEIVSLYPESAPKFLKRVREYDLAKLRERRGQNMAPFSSVQDPGLDHTQEAQKIRSSDVNKRLRDIRMGKF